MDTMRNTKTILLYSIIGISCFLGGFSWGDTLARHMKKGNKLFDAGQYEEALRAYTEADVNSKPGDPRLPQLYYNMGNALYQQGKYDQASAMYQKALEASDDGKFEADVHYNSGNAWLKQGNFQQALEAYTQALELNPKHEQARQNKEMVEKLIAQQQQQQQCQNQDNKENKDQQQDQNQEQQEGQQPPQQQDEQQAQEQEQQPQPAKEQESEEDKEQQLSEEEALRILDALKEKEELLQQERPMPPRPVEKDW